MRFLTKLMDIRFRAEKDPVSARANTGIKRLSAMGYRQAGGGLVGIPPLDEPLVHCGGAGGVGGEAGDERRQLSQASCLVVFHTLHRKTRGQPSEGPASRFDV